MIGSVLSFKHNDEAFLAVTGKTVCKQEEQFHEWLETFYLVSAVVRYSSPVISALWLFGKRHRI